MGWLGCGEFFFPVSRARNKQFGLLLKAAWWRFLKALPESGHIGEIHLHVT